MSLKMKAFDVNHSDIFANDKIGRRGEVENIARLLANTPSPLTLSVNSVWGSGKTAFALMLKAYLKETGSHAIYFSAWESDYASDPLLAFLGEVGPEIEKIIGGSPAKEKAWALTKKAGNYIAKRGVPLAIKVVTHGIIDLSDSVEDAIADHASGASADLLGNYLKEKDQIAIFKNNIAKLVTEDVEGGAVGSKKLYVFIDELDRCRPSYAIELLERIKHLLDIEGLVFVLVMDQAQLAHSVKALYGEHFDGSGYLKRFVDIEYSLKAPDTSAYAKHCMYQIGLDEYFRRRSTLSHELRDEQDNILRAITALSHTRPLSLRELEQFLARIKIIYLSTADNTRLPSLQMTFFLFFKLYLPNKVDFGASPEQLREQLVDSIRSCCANAEVETINFFAAVEAYVLKLSFDEFYDANTASRFVEEHRRIRLDVNEPDGKRAYSADVLRIYEAYSDPFGRGIKFSSIYNKITMLDSFNFSDAS